jgi:hypothetical protein
VALAVPERPAHVGSPAAASFVARSYAPGQVARLRVESAGGHAAVLIFRAGYGHDGAMQGRAVSDTVRVHRIRIGDWPSGLYYARVTVGGRTAVAPFVLRPGRLGAHRVLVVLPTNTWQAYNFEGGDSWYLNPSVSTVGLRRPYVDRGVPPHYRGYDRGFIRWLALTHRHPDVVSDDDLEHVTGSRLARLYDLIVFSGHEEYVTPHAYEAIERYRDLGGNLAFLSANNFFYRVLRRGKTIIRSGRWRDLGRREGVRRRGDELRRLGAVARGARDDGQPLGEALATLITARASPLRAEPPGGPEPRARGGPLQSAHRPARPPARPRGRTRS